MQRFTRGDRSSYSLLSCSIENLLPFLGLEGFFITLFKVTAFATAKHDPKEAVASCHEAAVAAFLVALGQIGLFLPCSRTWCWVTAVVQVRQDFLPAVGTRGEVATAGLWLLFVCLKIFGVFCLFFIFLKKYSGDSPSPEDTFSFKTGIF